MGFAVTVGLGVAVDLDLGVAVGLGVAVAFGGTVGFCVAVPFAPDWVGTIVGFVVLVGFNVNVGTGVAVTVGVVSDVLCVDLVGDGVILSFWLITEDSESKLVDSSDSILVLLIAESFDDVVSFFVTRPIINPRPKISKIAKMQPKIFNGL